MTELISVIIANYNRSALLGKAIESIINQKSDVSFLWEIIIVDDGSTDDSRVLIEQYMASYPENIRAIYQQNQGVNVARNIGINALSELSAYVIILDNDDEITPGCFDVYLKTWNKLRKQGRYDSVFTVISYCQDEHGTLLGDKKILGGKPEISFDYKDYLRTFFELREMMSMDKSSTYRDNPEFRFDEKQLIGEAILWVQIYKKMYQQGSGALIIDHIGRLFRLHHGPRTSHNIKPERFINSAESNEKIFSIISEDLLNFGLLHIYQELLLRIAINYKLGGNDLDGSIFLKKLRILGRFRQKILSMLLALIPRKVLQHIYKIYTINH